MEKIRYVEKTQSFVIEVPRRNGQRVQELIVEHGFDLSISASSSEAAVLFTHEPYAAASFWENADDSAINQLGSIIAEIGASWKTGSEANILVPADKELWGFQKAGVEYALRRKNTLIADQPGLGKTAIAIAFCNEVRAKRILVVCPASIRIQWSKSISEWSTMPWIGVRKTHLIMTAKSGVSDISPWTIVSYDMARTPAIWRALAKETYDVIILDEAHYLATTDTRRTRAIFGGGDTPVALPIASRAARIIALTGTPATSRPRQAYTLARNLCWDSIDWLSEDGFKARFNPSIKRTTATGKVFIDERTGRHAELQSRFRANFMSRHIKRDVMSQLKYPVYDLIQLEETGPVKQALAAESLLDINPEALSGADAAVMGQISAVRKQMGIALAPQIADYIAMLLDGGEEKLVVFGWHVAVLDILEESLKKYGVCRIDGTTSLAQREARKQAFIDEPGKQIILGNIQAMGVGVDGLQQVAWHVLLAEPDWTPGNNQQAIDRLDRGGQENQVLAEIFVAPNSIAERILAAALRKLGVLNKCFDKRFFS